MKMVMMGVWCLAVGVAVAAPTGVKVNGTDVGDGSGSGWTYDVSSGVVTLTGGDAYELSGSDETAAVSFVLDGSMEVTLRNLSLACAGEDACCLRAAKAGANVTLRLAGVSTLDASAGGEGLCVDNGAKLTIAAASGVSDDGAELIALGGEGCAAISVGKSGGSRLEIAGGTVRANGLGDPKEFSVGIGTSYDWFGGCGTSTVVISGGRVFARGGAYEPGIGAADWALSGAPDVLITGGYVEAAGGSGAAGIGGGVSGQYGSATVSGGTVVVTGGDAGYPDMLAGDGATGGGGLAITGGNLLLANLAAAAPDPAPTNATGQTLWCVTVEGLEGLVSLEGLEGYDAKDLVATAGKLCLWLPNGEYSFVAETRNASVRCTATVADANVTAEVQRAALGVTVNGVDVGWGFGEGWHYDMRSHYVEVTGGGSYVLSGTNTAGEVMFAIDADAQVTLSNLCLKCTTEDECCLWATNNVNVTLFLAGTNTLDARDGSAGEMGEGLCIENGSHLVVTNAPGCADADAVLVAKGSKNRAAIAVGRNGNEGPKPYFEIAGGTIFANWENPAQYSAGIGSSYRPGWNGEADIVISGGFVFARGGDWDPGIGAADYADSGTPDIRIAGGCVEAVGGERAAGIGGGYWGRRANVTVSGGTVKVTGGSSASDMLAGDGDKGGGGFAVTGGSVCLTRLDTVAPNPAPTNALGQRVWCVMVEGLEGLEGLEGSEGSVSLEGLEGYGVKDIVPVDGKIYLWLPNGEHRFVINGRAHYCATVDGANAVATPSTPYRAWNAVTRKMEDLECADFTVVTADRTTFENGKWYAVTGTVSCGRITVNGTAHLILCDGATLTATGVWQQDEAGIAVLATDALEIYGQTLGTGELVARGGMNAAGIGGNGGARGGTVRIDGGRVTAYGGHGGAGIGAGGSVSAGLVGTVTINGGLVTAEGGMSGAGIGGGMVGAGGAVTVNGGTVTATGGSGGSDIGRGSNGASDGALTITGGNVKASTAEGLAKDAAAQNVYCVTVEGLEGLVSLEGLGGYGKNDIYPVDGKIYLWLPNGEHRFFVKSAEGVDCYEAVVRGANVTATKIAALPVSPGKPLGPYETALAATNALGTAVFTPPAAVAGVLTSDAARTDYAANFGLVVTGGDGAWYVSAELTPAAEAKLAASAASVTTNLNLMAIAALPTEGTANLTPGGGVLGFYYTLCGAAEVRALPDGGAQYGPALCASAAGEVVFPNVKKPSDAAGFFTVSVKESAE